MSDTPETPRADEPEQRQMLLPALPGYRPLDSAELELIAEIKAHEQSALQLLAKVRAFLGGQLDMASPPDKARIADAEPMRWHAIARTDMQQAYMALVRSVAQPQTVTEARYG